MTRVLGTVDLWSRIRAAQPPPDRTVVVVTVVVAAALVVGRRPWALTRHAVTIAHEAAHGVVALVGGRRLAGIRLHADSSGVTLSRGRPEGPGMVTMLAAGYLGPAAIGLAAAGVLASDHAVGLLWGLLVLLALLLLQIRNFFGLVVGADHRDGRLRGDLVAAGLRPVGLRLPGHVVSPPRCPPIGRGPHRRPAGTPGPGLGSRSAGPDHPSARRGVGLPVRVGTLGALAGGASLLLGRLGPGRSGPGRRPAAPVVARPGRRLGPVAGPARGGRRALLARAFWPPAGTSGHDRVPVQTVRSRLTEPGEVARPRWAKQRTMDLALTEDQEQFRSAARAFLDREVVPNRTAWDRAESVDLGIVAKLGELGFFGLTMPEEYGGLDEGYVANCLLMEELGRGDSAIRGIVSVSLGLVAKTVHSVRHRGAEAANGCPGMCSGDALGCFGADRAGQRLDAANLTTRAVRDGDCWLISGSEDVHHQRHLGRRRAGLRPHRRAGAQRHHRVPGAHRHAGLRAPGRSTASSGCAARRPPSCFLDQSGCPTRPGWARRAGASRSPCRAGQGPDSVAAGCVGIAQAA